MLGPFGVYAYSVGFWAAVFASLLGVWQSVPYLYADFYGILKKLPPDGARGGHEGHEHAVPAGAGLHHARADAVCVHRRGRCIIIVTYTIVGSLFVPFLAATLLYLNNRVRVDDAGAAQPLDDQRCCWS